MHNFLLVVITLKPHGTYAAHTDKTDLWLLDRDGHQVLNLNLALDTYP